MRGREVASRRGVGVLDPVTELAPDLVRDLDEERRRSEYEAQANPTLWGAFREVPVTIRQFVTDPLYGAQGEIAWPEVLNELEGIFGTDPTRFLHEEAVLVWSIGGGKSFLVSSAFSYMLYWCLNLKSPQRYLGGTLAPESTIMFINQSIREEQARKIIFHEVGERIRQSPWFVHRRFLPSPHIKSELRFTRGITLLPGNSSLSFPHGYNLFGAVIDEAAHFHEPLPGTEGRDPAEEIYRSMRQRIRSRFGRRGLLVMISNPRHADDFMEKHYALAEFGDPEKGILPMDPRRRRDGYQDKGPKVYASRKALWDTKPGPDREAETDKWNGWNMMPYRQVIQHPDGTQELAFEMRVPELLYPEFMANPEAAKSAYAAIVSRTGMGYFWDPDMVDRPWHGIGSPGYNPDRVAPFNTELQLVPMRWTDRDPNTVCHAHVDLSLKRDATGLCVAHTYGRTMIGDDVKPIFYVDLMMEMKVPEGHYIEFQDIRNIIYQIQSWGVPIVYTTFDGWQSVDSIQQLNKRGMDAGVLSVDRTMEAYETLKEALIEGRINYYRYKPFTECIRSLILVKGKKVDHRENGKKDVSDAMAACVQTLTERWMLQSHPSAGRVRSLASMSIAGSVRRRDAVLGGGLFS